MKLFVDDSRDFPRGFECCRDYETAITLLSLFEFEYISLDYSLGVDCKNGLDILVWMKQNNIFVNRINIHSNHIFGKEKMLSYCEENFKDSKITAKTLPK